MNLRRFCIFCFIAATGFVLRAPVNAFGPMADALKSALGMDAGLFGLIAGTPLLTFGVFAFLSRGLAGRSLASIAALALSSIIAGALVRSLPYSTAVFAGTVLVSAAIAQLNVILPVVIKTAFADKAQLMTGFLCTMIGISSSLGSVASVPLIEAFDAWQAPFLFWGLAALPALFSAAALVGLQHQTAPASSSASGESMTTSARRPFPWRLGFIFALQATISTVLANWLPAAMAASGASLGEGAALVALFFLATVPGSFAAAFLRSAMRRPGFPVLLFTFFTASVVLIGTTSDPALWRVFAAVAGVAQGIFITLSFTLLQTESRSADEAFRLSSRVQGAGYCLAGLAPAAAAVLIDLFARFAGLGALPVVLGTVALAAFLWCILFTRTLHGTKRTR